MLFAVAPLLDAQSDRRYELHLQRQMLTTALQDFSRQTGLQIAQFTDVGEGNVTANDVVGSYTAEQALDLLLAGSGLQFRFINGHTIAIVRGASAQQPSGESQEAKRAQSTGGRRGSEATVGKPGTQRHASDMLFDCGATACSKEAATLAEVVVTAMRVQENLQRAPVAVTAVSSSLFEQLGGGNASLLQMVVPNVQMNMNGGGGGQFGIRGITTSNTTDAGDPAVAFEIDGLYLARAQNQGATLFDVDRIEVLRGPQGTLYGRNATTGVINVITRKPSHELGGSGYAEVGNFGAWTGFAALNVPVSDAVAIRGAFISTNHDPIYDNGLPKSQNYGDQHESAGRVHVAIDPGESLSILLTGDYSRLTGNGAPFASLFPTTPLDSTPYRFQASEPGDIDLAQWSGKIVLDWRLPWATLTYDGGVHSSNLFNRIGANVPGPPIVVYADPLYSRTWQHEVRMTHAARDLKYVAGVFLFRERQSWNIFVAPHAAFLMPDEEQDSKAAFGQATYSLNPALRLTGGLRYTVDHKARRGGNYDYDANGELRLTLQNEARIESSRLNYRLSMDYDVAPASMLYVSYATGYKAGGFFDGIPPGNTYGPENVGSAEIGFKGRFAQDRVQMNIAAFHYRYTDFQVSYQDRESLITRTYNAQEARNFGLELELQTAPTANDRINASLMYLHARYSKFDLLDEAIDTYGNHSYTGKRLPYAPEWGISLNAEHSWTLDGGSRITAGVLSHWQGQSELEFHNFTNTRQGAYSRTDANLSWTDATSRYSVTAFVRNAENRAVLTGASLQSDTDPTAPAAGTLAPPRTYGARFTVVF